MLVSEDDIRAKIVLPWLINHGFNLSNIHVEYSFSIRLGRSVFKVDNGNLVKESAPRSKLRQARCTFNPRADVLVRSHDGKNLLIIEVKKPNQTLDNDARDQGISYARLLVDGNIAPFVVLTNGCETKVFNSITTERVDGNKISADDISNSTGFYTSGDDLSLRAEALQTLISLSANNLIAFCEAQSAFRMRPLLSENLFSGKKYIPSLYVEREEANKKLIELLDVNNRRVVVLVGPPQVGKTNFICHIVEERLKRELPCLFYPAIGVKQSLFSEMAEDFEWVLGEVNNSYHLIHKKLRNILSRSGKKIVIFIDGWNEANLNLARIIDHESERLSCAEIQIVITLTHVAAGRLLAGAGGNPSFIAEAASIPSQAAQLIEIDPEAINNHSNWSIVKVERYSEEEMGKAYSTYAQAYNVKITNTHKKVYDPYLLGASMRLYQGKTLPDRLEEPNLLERVINDKANRSVGLEDYNVRSCLTEVARDMFTSGSPVSVETVSNLWKTSVLTKLPCGFFDSALLAQVSNEQNYPAIDFYYSKERDYIIAYWVQNWAYKLKKGIDVSSDFNQATSSNAGIDALRWFFMQSEHIKLLQLNDGSLPKYRDAPVTRILLSALCATSDRCPKDSKIWLEYAVDQATHNDDNIVRIEAVKLVALLADNKDDLVSIFNNECSLEEFVYAILSVNEEYRFQAESAGWIIPAAIRTIHWESSDMDSDESEITNILNKFLHHNSGTIRKGAAECFGYAAPHGFLQALVDEIKGGMSTARFTDYISGIQSAISELNEIYYGSMCPGFLDGIRESPEILSQEYERMVQIIRPLTKVYPQQSIQGLLDILDDLNPQHCDAKEDQWFDPYTLPLPFPDP